MFCSLDATLGVRTTPRVASKELTFAVNQEFRIFNNNYTQIFRKNSDK